MIQRMYRLFQGFARLVLVSLFLFACDRSQSAFEKTRQFNTIEAYNSFIKKYPNKPLSSDAINLRDQLAFEMTADSTTTDSLAPLKTNVLENLFANAERSWLDAKNNPDNIKAAEEFERAAQFYQWAASIQKIVGNDTTEALKKAAYAYYKAARQSQEMQMIFFNAALNHWLGQGRRLNLQQLTHDMIEAFIPHHLEKSLLYEQSSELFRKAGMEKHADWMMEEGTIKTFELSELEIVLDSVGTKTNK